MNITLHKDILAVSPILALSIGALILLMLEVFLGKQWKRGAFTAFVLVIALVCVRMSAAATEQDLTVFSGLMYADPLSNFLAFLIIAGALLSVLLGTTRLSEDGVTHVGEYYALLLMSTVGAIIFVSSAELITFFLGLEIMSIALYSLCGSALSNKRSSEAALKYFLLGSFSSAFLLYGIALIYGLTGSTLIYELPQKLVTADPLVVSMAVGLMLVGLIFKVGAVPFHFWAPDVYQGAPTALTGYMACVIKVASVSALMRVLWGAFSSYVAVWQGALWTIAALTMLLGNLSALRQRSMKRMLAYSSIAHAGYILVAFLCQKEQGGAAIMYYLMAYTVMTMGAFGVVLAVSSRYSSKAHPDDISRFNGLSKRSPFLAALMALFLLSLAGIPPGLGGLLAKLYIFSAAIRADYVGLAIVGVISSAISVYYYLRVIVAMYFVDGEEKEELPSLPLGLSFSSALVMCGACVIFVGLFPSIFYDGVAALFPTF